MRLSNKIKVVCSNRHRFPVNLEKNRYRAEVYCPKCKDAVVVRKKHFFSPNPNWEKEKLKQATARAEAKRLAKRKKRPQLIVGRINVRRLVSDSLVMERLLQIEKEREKENKGGKQNE